MNESTPTQQPVSGRSGTGHYPWLERHRGRIELLSIFVSILGIVALIAAIWALRLSLRADKLLSNIDDSISTRYLAAFPGDMDEIIKLLDSAHESIVILADVACYGHLSRHDAFERYLQVLREKNEAGVHLSITLYDENSWHQFVAPRLDGSKLGAIKTDPMYKSFWDNLDYRYKNDRAGPDNGKAHRERIQSIPDLVEQLWRDEQWYQAAMPGITGWVRARSELPVYCWIVDGKVAIFTLVAESNVKSEPGDEGENGQRLAKAPQPAYQFLLDDQSFRTSHRDLVLALQGIVKAYSRPR